MTRASLLDLSLYLAWMGGIQPNTLKHHLQQATHATKGSDGLMHRFQLIYYPVVDQEFKDVDIQIPAELKAEIKQLSIDLDRACMGEKILRFEAMAQKAFVDWYVQHQNLTWKEDEEYWQSHLGKIPKFIGSLCIQLHMIENLMNRISSDEISLSIFEKSLRLAEYYIAHARKTYTSIESRELANAKKILRMIHSKKLEVRFKASDIYRNCSTTLKDAEVTHAALIKYLEEKRVVAHEKQISGVGRHSTDCD